MTLTSWCSDEPDFVSDIAPLELEIRKIKNEHANAKTGFIRRIPSKEKLLQSASQNLHMPTDTASRYHAPALAIKLSGLKTGVGQEHP
ncbi:MAG: hypothetical protein AAGF27_12350 [Pseudomonadota bacterium]